MSGFGDVRRRVSCSFRQQALALRMRAYRRDRTLRARERGGSGPGNGTVHPGHFRTNLLVLTRSARCFAKCFPLCALDSLADPAMYALETEMRTGDKNISVAEKIEIRILGPTEPEPTDVSARLLPSPSHCKEGTAANW